MLSCFNEDFVATPQGQIAMLRAFIDDFQYKTFDEIRASVPPLSSFTDEQLTQVIQDSGYEVVDQ